MKEFDANGYIYGVADDERYGCIGRPDGECVKMNESVHISGRFPVKCTGYLFFRCECESYDTIFVKYGPTKESLFFSCTHQVTQSGLIVVPQFTALRYFEISVFNHQVPLRAVSLKLYEFGIVDTAYPYLSRGAFSSSDDGLDKIWRMGAYTLKICTQKIENSRCGSQGYNSPITPYMIFDGPRRDREVWTGDIRCEALIAYAAYGDAAPVKSSLKYIADLQLPDGQMPASGCTKQSFLSYNLWWIVSLYEYCLYTGDTDFLDSVYPSLRNLEEYLIFHTDDRGELRNVDYTSTWMWTFPRGEYCCTVQMIYVRALECMAELENMMGERRRGEMFSKMRAKLSEQIVGKYWNDDLGVFEDDLYCDCERQPVLTDVNCFAVCFGVVKDDKAERILKYLENNMHTPYGSTTTDIVVRNAVPKSGKNGVIGTISNRSENPAYTLNRFMWGHNRKIWPFIVGYETEARFLSGDAAGALRLIDACWGNMLRQGADTCWEMSDTDGVFCAKSMNEEDINDNMNSAAHGWSGWVTYLISAYVAGIRPLKPGYSEFLFFPSAAGPARFKASVPVRGGAITAEIDRERKYIRLEYPENLTPDIRLENFQDYRLEKIPVAMLQYKGGKL